MGSNKIVTTFLDQTDQLCDRPFSFGWRQLSPKILLLTEAVLLPSISAKIVHIFDQRLCCLSNTEIDSSVAKLQESDKRWKFITPLAKTSARSWLLDVDWRLPNSIISTFKILTASKTISSLMNNDIYSFK